MQQLLDRRAAAVLADDEDAFLATVAPGRPAFLAQQRQVFDNLRLLPVADLSFRLDGARILRSLTLDGFDGQPEVGPAGFGAERRGHRLLVVPPSPAERGTDPWDLTAIEVRAGPRVLAVSDRASRSRVDDVMSAVSHGIPDVERAVPGDWGDTVVVYVFADPAVLTSYAQVPGGNLRHLGGISFPVRGGPHGRRVVGSRLALLPGAMDVETGELARIVRHELTHVAVGARANGVPLWLSEGIAEYVAALPVPASKQRIATVAVRDARHGGVELPDAATFNDADQDLHYSVAWMACSYLADKHGASVLWQLLDAMRNAHVGRTGVGQDAVLRAVVGLDSTQLADHASARIRKQFAKPGS
ncbi:MAG: peptidase MA family metallohydrolase [Marmoricola sp.]